MSRPALQRKPAAPPALAAGLRVAPARDNYEAEASRVADRVASGGRVRGWSLSQMDSSGVQRQAAESAPRPRLHSVSRHSSSTGPACNPAAASPALVHSARAAMAPARRRSGMHPVLKMPGRALEPGTRAAMEDSFGCDLGGVRIHTDRAAQESAAALHANAYTIGSHIVFAPGRYAPNTTAGRKLLAHEITHVVQQDPSLAHENLGLQHAPPQIQREEEEKSPDPWSDLKGWVLAKLKKIPGYDLFCTVIGKDLVTGKKKDNSPQAMLHEVLKLVNGEAAYERVVAVAGAVQKAYDWVVGQLDALGLTIEYFEGRVKEAIDSVSFSDLKDIEGALARIQDIFRPAFDKIVAFAKAAFNKLFEIAVQVVMENFGDLGRQVMGFINKAKSTFMVIAKDPIKFVGNLVEAVKLGFSNFAHNILQHLQDALMDFMFGDLGPKIKPPKQFSVAGVFTTILDVLDLNYGSFRERMVKKTSEDTVSFLEGSFDFMIKLASSKSLAGAWGMFKEKAGEIINGLVDTAISAIKDWVVTKIVQAAIVKIVQLFNPASAIVAAIQAIYHTIVTLIEKGKQLLAVLNAVVESISKIAEGNITDAADWVEKSMGKAFSFILAFFAEQAGLGGIAKTIRGFITKVHDKVLAVFDKVIDFVVAKTGKLYAKAKATAGKVLAWWQQRKDFLIGNEEHAVFMQGTEDEPELMIASKPKSFKDYKAAVEPKIARNPAKKKLLAQTVTKAAELQKPFKRDKSAGESSEQVTRKRKLFDEICANIITLGFEKEAPPKSEVEFDNGLAQGDGGVRATAKVLSPLLLVGSEPSDNPDIWKNLGEDAKSVRRRKRYVQGHLLNHNVGGPGVRKNLTPINIAANNRHKKVVEKDIKRLVQVEKKVVFYEVKADYTGSRKKPKPMVKLEEAKAKAGRLTPAKEEQLSQYQAEQTLCTKFDWTWHELQRDQDKNQWVKVEGTGDSGTVPHEVDLTQ